MTGGTIAWLTVISVVVLLAVAVVVLLLRRHLLLSGLGAVTMWVRPAHSPRWSVGIASYGGDSLQWYRALSLSIRPQKRLSRAEFRIDSRRPAGPQDLALPPDTIVVSCHTRAGPQELAMDRSTVTGFLSWIESMPPATH